MDLLKMSNANAKTGLIAEKLNIPKAHICGFSVPAGYTCPGAVLCRSYAKRDGGIVDAPGCEFRCFAANAESQYEDTRNLVWHNFDLLEKARGKGGVRAMARLIETSLYAHNKNLKVCRIHVHGDFYKTSYFLAWILVARRNPNILFYAYTKSWHILSQHGHKRPTNFSITYSIGSKWDDDAIAAGWPNARVFMSEQDAADAGLEVCIDELPALFQNERWCDFALVIHGSQPKGSDAGKAVYRNRKLARERKLACQNA